MAHESRVEGGAQEQDPLERLAKLERQVAGLNDFVNTLTRGANISEIPIYVFERGQRPVRKTVGAIGYDAHARAIVDPASKPANGDILRETLADFQKTPGWEERIRAPLSLDMVVDDESCPDERYAIALPVGATCMVGLGYAKAMDFPVFSWMAPRSGYAASGVTIANSPGTIDPDYRGEAGALVWNHSDEDFVISHGMRIVQVIFQLALTPDIKEVEKHEYLPPSERGAGGFGSTGTHG